MKNIMNWVRENMGNGGSSAAGHGRDMNDVMRRVDQQIGRAVERLSDR